MKIRLLTACILSILTCGGRAAAQPVDAQDKAVAQSLFDDARALVEEGRHAEACPKLAESQRLDPSIGTRFYLAECLERTGRTASAWSLYLEVSDLARTLGQTARETYARERAERLAPALARLTVNVPVGLRSLAALQITRDGVRVGSAQWGQALPVDPGIHVVRATASGKEAWEARVNVREPGKTVVIEVPPLVEARPASAPIAPAPSAAASPVPEAPLPSGEAQGSTRRTVGVIVGGAGIALAAAGAVLGLVALDRRDRSNAGHCDATDTCDAIGVALRRESLDAANLSTALFVASGLAVAGGVVVYLTAPRPRSKPTTAIGITPTGLSLTGRF